MEAELALDALVEYGVEESGPEGDRPNPKRRPLEKELRQAKAEVARLQAALGEQAAMPDAPTSANWTAVGICAHESAMKGGERVAIPAY